MCHYWIEAQPGEKIEVILDSFSRGFQVEGCKYAGVEIKTGSDKRYTGYRFCSPSSSGTRLVSTYNVVPIITYNLRRPSTARLRYRSIRSDTEALESTSMPVTSTPSPSNDFVLFKQTFALQTTTTYRGKCPVEGRAIFANCHFTFS
ncbi:hypothetical protein DICVIV_13792 [Dictyocaulus viviparus]|uniref:CUB domain-containing protein n=1 Tax=Dictyocaulus viviparus TaxID=29172 RepID=A0A0D8X948_DICVI|nr:hypothetical protein DICVIV_13792 [Dictyocaulus viviparus]